MSLNMIDLPTLVELMKSFGINVWHNKMLTEFRILPGSYKGTQIDLEADASSACYPLALAAISGGRLRVTNIGDKTLQPDLEFLEILKLMGADVQRSSTFIEVKGQKILKGGFSIDMSQLSDQALTVAALAPFCDAPITVRNVEHIRYHESDRIAVACAELKGAGISVEERTDGFTVYPGTPQLCSINSNDDHRVAMSFSLWGACIPGVRIINPGCVSKTYPTFFNALATLGLGVQFVT